MKEECRTLVKSAERAEEEEEEEAEEEEEEVWAAQARQRA
jgi:hypothetical protein